MLEISKAAEDRPTITSRMTRKGSSWRQGGPEKNRFLMKARYISPPPCWDPIFQPEQSGAFNLQVLQNSFQFFFFFWLLLMTHRTGFRSPPPPISAFSPPFPAITPSEGTSYDNHQVQGCFHQFHHLIIIMSQDWVADGFLLGGKIALTSKGVGSGE